MRSGQPDRWSYHAALALVLAGSTLSSLFAQSLEFLPPLRVRPGAPVEAVPAQTVPAKAAPVQAVPVKAASSQSPGAVPIGSFPGTVEPNAVEPMVVPICLDTVLRLAQDQNGQVRIARERLEAARIKQDLAERRWLPDLLVGPSTLRHEGGIQDFNGRMIRSSYGSLFGGMELRGKLDIRDVIQHRIEAERAVLQQRGEVSKLTSEQLLDASSTYVDLLAARAALLISQETEGKLCDVLVQARKLANIDPGVRVEVVRIDAELESQKMLGRKLQEGSQSAKLKLLYTLGLDTGSELAILDRITMFQLVDERQPANVFVDQAMRSGPGVADMDQLLVLIDRLHAQAKKPQHFMPTVEMTMWEGAFGAGPGSRMDWENRWDVGVNLRWSINELLNSRDKQRLLDTQRQQMRLSQQEMRDRLALGVRQALEELRSSQEQAAFAVKHIQSAEESYKLSDARLRDNIKGRSPSEVLLAARALFAARLSYLHAVRDYDKAQLRLFVLTGCATAQ